MRISEKVNKMKIGIIKIIECFNITRIGVLTEIQHNENGIPPKTKIRNLNSDDIWIINKRVVSDLLILENAEIFFDCETKLEHISHSFKTVKDRKVAVLKEIEKRKKEFIGI